MKKRIFISISISPKIKQQLFQSISKWQDLPIHWTKPENLHITVFFIGSASDEEIINICDNIKQAARSFEPFDLEFDRIAFDSKGKIIWATGEKSQELANLKSAIENQLIELRRGEQPPLNPRAAGKAFGDARLLVKEGKEGIAPHITLGRVYASRWRKLENPPVIDEKISFSVPVNSIEIMESRISKEGTEYGVLENIEL